MSFVDDLIAAGFEGYRGWDPVAAQADFKATGGAGKAGGGGGGSSGGGLTGTFNFDYATEAEKAYGELGTYYNRLLTESQGDMTKVLSRLVEDYDRGVRIKREDYTTATTEAGRQSELSRKNLISNTLARGLYSQSAYGGEGREGRGIYDVNKSNLESGFAYNQRLRDTNLNRFIEEAGIIKGRTETDTKQTFERKKLDLEQNRRLQSAELANLKGSQAYQKFSSQLY